MKSRILIIIFLIINYNSIAQMKFGFTAGAQIASVKLVDYNTETRLCFNTGFVARSEISEGIDIHLQLLLTAKGYKYYDYYGYKDLFRPLYLELPVVFRFKFNSTNNAKIFLGAGGFFAYGIGGNKTYYPSGYKETVKINFGSTNSDDLENTDYGLVFQFGAAFRENYEGHFFYDMGLTRIVPNSTSNCFNRVFGFNLTWYFNSSN